MSGRQIAASLLVVLIWGMNFPICKFGLLEIPAFLFAALRFVIVACILIPFSPLPSGSYGQIFTLSLLLGVAHFGAFFFGLSFEVDAASASIIMQFGPPAAAMLGILYLREEVFKIQIFGLALAFTGICIVVGLPASSPDLTGAGILVFSALMWAIANVYMKGLKDIPTFTLWGWMSLFSTPFLLLFWYVLEDGVVPSASTRAYLSVLWPSIFSTIIAYSLWTKLIQELDLSKVAPFGLLVPIVGVVGALLLLGESIDIWFILGALLVVSGVVCSSIIPGYYRRLKARSVLNALN